MRFRIQRRIEIILNIFSKFHIGGWLDLRVRYYSRVARRNGREIKMGIRRRILKYIFEKNGRSHVEIWNKDEIIKFD